MNIFIIVLLVLLALVASFLIAGIFVKKDYYIERSIIILQPKEKIMEFIQLLKNQEQYNKWWMVDAEAKKTFTGTDGTVGFIVAWESKDKGMGKGEQEIKRITKGERIDFEIRFEKPFEGIANTFMAAEHVAEGTKVSWGFSGKNKYPINVIYKLLQLEKKLGDDLYESLIRLKKVIE